MAIAAPAGPDPDLTPGEREVLESLSFEAREAILGFPVEELKIVVLFAQSYSRRQIAEELGITYKSLGHRIRKAQDRWKSEIG